MRAVSLICLRKNQSRKGIFDAIVLDRTHAQRTARDLASDLLLLLTGMTMYKPIEYELSLDFIGNGKYNAHICSGHPLHKQHTRAMDIVTRLVTRTARSSYQCESSAASQ